MRDRIITESVSTVVGSKNNKSFMILSFLGILFVVDSHIGSCIAPATQVFPYGSFFMPMFMFVSGYFFNEKHIATWKHLYQFAKAKFCKLVLPYLGWILFYIIFTALLRALNVWEIGQFTFIDLIHNILTAGTSLGLNDPAWFVPLLYCVTIGYCLLRKLCQTRWHDGWAMVFFALLGALAVYASTTEFNTNNTYMIMKIPCFLQFYHLGVLFRSRLEAIFDKFTTLSVCLAAVIANLFLLAKYGSAIDFPMYASMSGFNAGNPFLPLITAVTGIAFWLKISKALVPIWGNNPLVNYISDNTAFIMTHHVCIKHLFLALLIWASQFGISHLQNIDVYRFRTDPWYTYSETPVIQISCFLFTLAILLLWCKGHTKLMQIIHRQIKHTKSH